MKLLTIVIPVYNVASYLRECLDSVLAAVREVEKVGGGGQRKDNLIVEIICVDDGSTDGSGAILDEYREKVGEVGGSGGEWKVMGKGSDPLPERCSFRVIHQQNGGYGRAVNRGFDCARGEWIAIVEPDDWVEEWMFEKLVAAGEKDGRVDVVKCGFSYVYDGVETQEIVWPDEVKNRVFAIQEVPELLHWHPSIWSCIYRHSFLRENNIRMLETPGASWADNPFQVQTLCLARGIACVEGAGYKYRVTGGKLKNWRLPFERSREIHEWMKEHNVDDLGLRVALSRRECVYLKIAAEVVPWRSIFAVVSAVHRLVDKWPAVDEARKCGLTDRELREYAAWRRFPCVKMIAAVNRYVRGVMKLLGIL